MAIAQGKHVSVSSVGKFSEILSPRGIPEPIVQAPGPHRCSTRPSLGGEGPSLARIKETVQPLGARNPTLGRGLCDVNPKTGTPRPDSFEGSTQRHAAKCRTAHGNAVSGMPEWATPPMALLPDRASTCLDLVPSAWGVGRG
ncbi:hypothetical protein GGTG_13082 [Gaeumannomyces tritici R3-111a-1]|uniref:Uncharacterized protein n=1 Tax=Gaeumannomyces tritici (strain R3-111a-1) TaxID=644352 RepID=J3PHV1_GAET3|nr:hypothetical protein GGTG_13082 [Gaeumannomyces tritici R3-111a-1]EJT69463.1 hypothetical protein GGTG_13082 [Gaeumannomyces tritici R3-111a-1]